MNISIIVDFIRSLDLWHFLTFAGLIMISCIIELIVYKYYWKKNE